MVTRKKVTSLDENPSIVFVCSGWIAKTGSVPPKVWQEQWSYLVEKELRKNLQSSRWLSVFAEVHKNYPFVRGKKIKVPSLPPKSGTSVATLCTLPRRQITQLHSQWALAVLPLYIASLKKERPLGKEHKLSVWRTELKFPWHQCTGFLHFRYRFARVSWVTLGWGNVNSGQTQ